MIWFVALLSILFLALAWRDLKHAALVLTGLLPIYLLRFDVLGIPSTMLEVFVWILIGVWVMKGWKEHRWKIGTLGAQRSELRELRVPITLILTAAVVSMFVAPDTTAALGILKAYFVEPLLVFVLVASVFERDDLPRIFTALGASALFLSLYAIVQKLTGLGIPEPWDTARRVTSMFEYPNAFGLFLAPILAATPPLLARAKYHGGWKEKIFWSSVFVLAFSALVFSETEAAWLAIPAVIWFLGWFARPLRRLSLVLTVVGCLLLLAPSTRGVIVQKVTLQDYSGQVRVSQWQETWDYLKDDKHWILGAGLSGYPTALAPYHTAKQYEIFQYPHNIFLNVWVELGLLGFIAFTILAVAVARLAWRNRQGVFVLAASAGLLEMLIHGLVDVPYFKNDLAVLTWLLVAVIVVVQKQGTFSTENP